LAINRPEAVNSKLDTNTDNLVIFTFPRPAG
jgi:hypothetical protein